jgi:hypothetical protein
VNAAPPPGWYPDDVGGGQRYWDGRQWTDQTVPTQAPLTASRPETAAHHSANRASVMSWVLRHKVVSGVAAFVLVASLVGALGSGEDEPATAAGDTRAAVSDDSDSDDVPIADIEVTDADGDGTPDEDDLRPNDPDIQTEDDLDSDNDGVRDGDDLRPNDPKVQTEDDIDTDGDGVADYRDDFPKDPNFSKDADGDRVADQLDAFPQDARYSQDSDGDRHADAADAFPADPSRWKVTLAMDNALGSANDYLSFSAFSRQGLIDQLSSSYADGYSVEDATWAVSQLDVDWREQAVLSAKDYLSFSSFSRQGLIDQLSSRYGSQFTVEEAVYAVNKIGL